MNISRFNILELCLNTNRYKIIFNDKYFYIENSLKYILQIFRNENMSYYKNNRIYYKKLNEVIKDKFNDGYHIIITDIKNAYNSVNRNKLMKILKDDNKLDNFVYDFLQTYYNNFIFSYLGKTYLLYDGLPIGCPLSSLLFKIYIKTTIPNDNFIIYEDDIVIYNKSYDELHKDFDKFKINIDNIDLSLNAEKTSYLHNSSNTISDIDIFI